MSQIQKWLTDPKRDFQQGVDLLNQVCRNKRIIDFLRKKGPNAQSWEKLEYNLRKFGHVKVEVPKQKAPIDNAPVKITKSKATKPEKGKDEAPSSPPSAKVNPEELPDELQIVYNAIRMGVPRIAALKNELKHAESDANRKAIAEELLRLENEQIEGWKMIDEFQKTGKFNFPKAEPKATPEDANSKEVLLKKRKSCVDAINRAKREMKKLNPEDKKYKNRVNTLAKKEKELAQIDEKLAQI